MDKVAEHDIPALMAGIGTRARAAAAELATAAPEARRAALEAAAKTILATENKILTANSEDMAFAREKGLSKAMLDRLWLTPERIRAIAEGLRSVAAQADPVGAVIAEWDMPSGLHIRRVRTPLGVVGVIYESRPNVTADAGGLCLKAGNAAILRGGSESFHSSGAIHACLQQGLAAAGLPVDAVQLVPTRDRAAVTEMLHMTGTIDVIVPRGGKGLVGLVQAEARVPVFAHLEGICHVYLDGAADPTKARAVALNAKTRRTGICGAAECLLIDRVIANTLGAAVVRDLLDAGVVVHGCAETRALDPRVLAATDQDWGPEYLDLEIAARVVETQFADGAEFGMGAEIGIATGKMHARGPVGAEQLTSFKYLVEGDGTIRP